MESSPARAPLRPERCPSASHEESWVPALPFMESSAATLVQSRLEPCEVWISARSDLRIHRPRNCGPDKHWSSARENWWLSSNRP